MSINFNSNIKKKIFIYISNKYLSYSLVSSADKVFRGAQEKYIDKDEEAAYVQYMRFIELVLLLQKRPDFKKVCICFIFPYF